MSALLQRMLLSWLSVSAGVTLAALAAVIGTTSATAQTPVPDLPLEATPPVNPAAGDLASSQPEPLYAAPTRADRSGRILAAVEIDGKGPYRFIVDTGANRSALAPGVAQQLGLPYVSGGEVEVHGVTGTAMLPGVQVTSLRAGELLLPPSVLPVVSGDIFGGADGILGVAGIQGMRLDVDFLHDRVVIAPSSGRRAPDGFLVVRAGLWKGGLLLVNGRVGSVPAKIIIDTGAEHTMGNMPLRALLLDTRRHGEEFDTTVLGATPDIGSGTYFRAPMISIGGAQLLDLPVTFGDLHVFDLWGLAGEPALVVGMDVLGRLERFIIDYRRKEFQIKGSDTHGSMMRRCTSSTCGSRIPESGT
jgi:predicted aspartyl protease